MFLHPTENGQRSNLYKFILVTNAEDPKKDFYQIKSRTSPVYDYSLGNDEDNIKERHICLPIWYQLENTSVENVTNELKR